MNNILRARNYGRNCFVTWRHLSPREYTTAVAPKAALEKYQPGEVLHGYKIESVEEIPELYLTAVRLSHLQTGAEHLHIARDDTNNVFSVGFRTTPMDNTGVSHILEHTVLCGSQKYPCRDPFFKMLNRSLSTFMNAWTASDYTMYPFSTQNAKDYQNLLSVYLDAVFFPNLDNLDFLQEGWRLEHSTTEDQDSPIIFKGVVFNEMKGAMSSPDQLYAVGCQTRLHPSHTYSYNSGGDPVSILDLTHQQLKDFHASHYHPSNARFYTYGDIPLEGHLEVINQSALKEFQKINPGTEIPSETRWTEMRSSSLSCPPDTMAPDPDKQTTVSVSYLLPRITEVEESFAVSLLSALLTSGPTSPFYQALLDAGIGSDYSPVCGYDGSTRDASFSIGLQGIHPDDEERVRGIIQETVDKVVREGFEPDRIEAILHSVELAQRHQTTSFGLQLISSLMPIWNQDGDPISAIQLDRLVAAFRKRLSDNPRHLQDLVQKHLIDNQHQLWLRMSPDEDYSSRQEKNEAEKLGRYVEELNSDEKQQVYSTGLQLAAAQNDEPDVSCLPTVTMGDIDPETRRTPITTTDLSGSYLQLHEQPTNGVTYFRGVSSLRAVDRDLLMYLPLFCNVVTQMGTEKLHFRDFAKREELKTGGLSVRLHIMQDSSDTGSYELGAVLSSHCLDRNMNDMMDLWQQIFQSVTLSDQERLSTLIRMEAADLSNSVAFMGHAFAMRGSSSSLSPVGQLGELTGGMSQVNQMKEIAELEDLSEVITKLQKLSSLILNRTDMRFCLNASPDNISTAVDALGHFVDQLPGQPKDPQVSLDSAMNLNKGEGFSVLPCQRHFKLPFPVNYVSIATTAVPYKHEDFSRLTVLAKLLSAKFLHKEIREKGGAYGSGATMSGDGTFKFYSYRDPHSMDTLGVFQRSLPWIRSGGFTDQDLDEAKIAVFSNVDTPIAPGSKGVSTFLSGITDDDRQLQRNRLFNVSRDDVINTAERYLGEGSFSAYLIGPENEVTERGDWSILQ